MSLEHDTDWMTKVEREIMSAGLENCELVHRQLRDLARYVSGLPSDAFDLAVVDCEETEPPSVRIDCIAALRSKIRPGGWLILDDSDDRHYAESERLLPDWHRRRFIGTRPEPLLTVETTVYQRPTAQPAKRRRA